MQWIHATDMNDLSPADLYQMLRLRQNVFIIEQECIYDDIDNVDPHCEHLLLKDQNKVAGCLRIVPANKKFEFPSIGRIAIKKTYRRKGYGKKMVRKALEILSAKNTSTTIIEAQSYLQSFYESLDFSKISKPYPVDGILHIKMEYHF